ncbi:peroxiredoxin [Helicobacter monodelphidis]|uniref:OsmC family protein n=1 Tax=Helicobacter sp. 15-1451 TaxID=2004995 RepID=UPI000DCCC5C3|nr:OsmC family protein [Helicobacter sp. 15-1451]RAX57529.1 peroxiredoxin [Helicobacter sp. 15-1451]
MSENKVAVTACTRLDPIDKAGLEALIKAGKENPEVIKTLKCKTVAKGKFRHENYIRNLPAYIVDEPPTLLGDDTAPNPSEALLAALGSCLAVGIHANAIAQNVVITKLELELEGDLNITAVWGTGDLSEDKPLGFTDVRVKVDLQSNADEKTQNAIISHATKYSPVANTLLRAVNLKVN